jgi:hypothetical protein
MMAELQRIFDAYNQAGRVRLEYSTRIYFGRLAVPSKCVRCLIAQTGIGAGLVTL